MMKTKYYFQSVALLATTVLTAASCINDEAASRQPDELRLRSGLDVAATRGSDAGFTTAFFENDQVDVFILEKDAASGSISEYAQPEVTTVQADRKSLAFAAARYWPKSGHSLYLYGWYPKGAAGASIDATDRTFAVQADQSGGIKSSDLMWGVPGGVTNPVEKQAAAVLLQFRHRLSKLKVVLTPDASKGMTAADLQNATVTLAGVRTTVAVTDLKAGTVATQAAPTATLTVMSGSTALTGYAIVPAQDLGGLTLTVTLASGNSLKWTFPTSDPNFVTTQEHMNTYTLTVGRTELKVEGAITDWEAGTSGSTTLTL